MDIIIPVRTICIALSMRLNGAAGQTFKDMKKALRLEGKVLEQINETYLKLMA